MQQRILDAVRAVVIVEATKRKPSDFEDLTFFSATDLWGYRLDPIQTTCDACRELARASPFSGDNLRATFPYLEIVSEDAILPSVHPHCRCLLIRVKNHES